MAFKMILAVNFSEDRLKQVHILGMLGKAKVKAVADGEKDESIGILLGLTAEEISEIEAMKKDLTEDQEHDDDAATADIHKEALIFCGFDNATLNKVLNGIRRGPLKEVPLKAMVTPNNISWTIRKVLGELEKEHQYFASQKK
jgi:hypothetical protein